MLTYGLNLLGCALAYTIMTIVVLKSHGPKSEIAVAIGQDKKGKISLVFYLTAVALALFTPMISCALYLLVAIIWLVPDKRIERMLP